MFRQDCFPWIMTGYWLGHKLLVTYSNNECIKVKMPKTAGFRERLSLLQEFNFFKKVIRLWHMKPVNLSCFQLFDAQMKAFHLQFLWHICSQNEISMLWLLSVANLVSLANLPSTTQDCSTEEYASTIQTERDHGMCNQQGFSRPLIWRQWLEGMSSMMYNMWLPTNVLNLRGFPSNQFNTIVLSIQAYTSWRGKFSASLTWNNNLASRLAPQSSQCQTNIW